MQSSKRTATSRYLQIMIVSGICAGFIVAADGQTDSNSSAHDPIEYSIWKKRIKRLKPADPESTEVMFADANPQAARYSHILS